MRLGLSLRPPVYPFPDGLVAAIDEIWSDMDIAISTRLQEMGELEHGHLALDGIGSIPDLSMSGSYGVVYETTAPGWVVKVSCDPTEGPAAEAIRQDPLLSSHPGVVTIAGVWVVPDIEIESDETDEFLPLFIILREAVRPLGEPVSIKDQLLEGSGPPDLVALLKVRESAIYFNLAIDESERAAEEMLLDEKLERLESFRHARLVADFMGLFKEIFHTALADIHPGNVGMRPGDDSWVIFDVGHSEGMPGVPTPCLPEVLFIETT